MVIINSPKIAIIGAGPSGLTLASILHKQRIACQIYELDAHQDARPQGGSLDLHADSGQLALRAAGLYDQFLKYARFSGDTMRLCDPSGKAYIDENIESRETQDRPEIDRADLRRILLDSLPAGTVQWNRKLRDIEQNGHTGKYILHFINSENVPNIDLVIGADGAWSKVRPLVTDSKPFYSGVSGVGATIYDAPKRKPQIADMVGAGSFFVIGDFACIICQINGDNSVKSYFYREVPEGWLDEGCGIDWSAAPTIAKHSFIERYWSNWDDGMKALILEAEDTLELRKLYMLPVGLTWNTRPGVTLIGDAAHLMTPFAGVGVNIAMHDAAVLAENLVPVICDNSRIANDAKLTSIQSPWQAKLRLAIEAYEADMFSRSKNYTQLTWENKKRYISLGGAPKVAAAMKRRDEFIKAGKGIEALLGYS